MSDIKLFLLHLDDHIRTILAETTEQNGDVLLSMGGVQPEKGNEKLYVLREVFSGNVLAAKNMKSEASRAIVCCSVHLTSIGAFGRVVA